MKQHYSIAFLVLLYGKEIAYSETLTSLKLLPMDNDNALLVIWNNGPERLSNRDVKDLELQGFDVNIIETIENRSLAKIYNQFIAENVSEKYIVLDDDSSLNKNYLDDAFKLSSDEIGVPLIYSNGVLTWPQLNHKLCEVGGLVTNKDKFFGIGSGLVIGSKIAQQLKIEHNDIFDERFYFYGVDSTFFFRVHLSRINNKIRIITGFEHSLSISKKETSTVKDFRLKEMSYDIGLRLRYYKPLLIGLFLVVEKSVLSLLSGIRNKKRKIIARHLIKAFISGKHYRV